MERYKRDTHATWWGGKKGRRKRTWSLRNLQSNWGARQWLAFAVWLLISGVLYNSLEISHPFKQWASGTLHKTFFAVMTPARVAPRVAWALSLHCVGFGLFVFITTRQSKWLLATAMAWLGMLWGIGIALPEHLAVKAANTLGYAVLGLSLLVGLGALGGACYVFADAIEFCKNIVTKYPKLAEGDLQARPLLHRVVVGEKNRERDSPRASSEEDKAKNQACFLCGGPGERIVSLCGSWEHGTGTSDAPSSLCTTFATLKEDRDRLFQECQALKTEIALQQASMQRPRAETFQ